MLLYFIAKRIMITIASELIVSPAMTLSGIVGPFIILIKQKIIAMPIK
jgi:hypothetical protein